MDLNHSKQELGLVQHVQKEPALVVKEETLENIRQDDNDQQCVQDTSTLASTKGVNEACNTSPGNLVNVKHDLTDMEIGPTVIQHINLNYKINKTTSDVMEENRIENVSDKSIPCDGAKKEIVEDKLRDSSSNQVHRSEEHDHQTYRCNKCLKVFKSNDSRHKHINTVHGTEPHKCIHCNKEFKCKAYLRQHIRNTHEQYECDRRRSADSSSSKQVDDGIEECKYQGYKCDICLNVYKSKIYLKIHSNRKHGKESHKCAQCNKKFICEEYLSEHVKNTHLKQAYKCNICKKMYPSRAALRYHNSTFHRKKSAGSSSSKQVDDGIEECKHQGYKCDICLNVYKSKSILKHHSNRKHGKESHKCAQCNKKFICEEYLSEHVKNKHRKKVYKCNICKKVYPSRAALCYHNSTFHRNRSADKQQGDRGAATASTDSSADVAARSADQCSGLAIKQESDDTDLDIGPTVLQHVDSHYTFSQKAKSVKMESPPLQDEQTVKIELDLSMKEDSAGV